MNAGGGVVVDWVADYGHNGGGTWGTANSIIGVPGGVPMAVYQTERYNDPQLIYQFFVPSGTYNVRLHLAESYYYYVGDRVFNINVNGTMRTNVDILAMAGGRDRALYLDWYGVTVNPGSSIYIQMTKVSGGGPKVNGIEITKL